MNPSNSAGTATTAAPQGRHLWKGTAVFDSVKVSPDTFRSVEFRGAVARKQFTDTPMPDASKPQRMTRNGVPVWSVKVLVDDWRGRQDILLTVTVPMHDDPTTKFRRGQEVELPGLVFGVSPKNGGGYVTWCSADDITPASRADSNA